VNNNLVIATHQLSSVLAGSFAWNNPIAAFSIFSNDGILHDNIAAGSVDGGYHICQGLFINRADDGVCDNTFGVKSSISIENVTRNRAVWNNEIVAGKIGVNIIALSTSEARASDCAAVTGFKAWRNSHAGFMSIDTEANIIVGDTVVAENHIGELTICYKCQEAR
jgi:hypothetical protein